MKRLNYLILTAFISLCLNAKAQNLSNPRARITIDIGGINPTGLNNSIDNKSSIATGFSFEKPFFLKDWLYFTSGVGINNQKYFIDAYFANSGNGIEFKPVENGVINNKIEITSFKIPLLFSFPLFSKNDKAIALSAGFDVDIFLNGSRKYKEYNGEKKSESFSFERKVQLPLRFEISTINLSKQSSLNNLFYGFGVRQQLTNYNQINSFKPFEAYLRLGIQL